MTDEDTGNLLLGPRLYDPATDRFTTADSMVAATANMALGIDSLTGNRYLFAAANPVGFYDDGYSPLIDPRRYDTGPPVTPPQAHWVDGELADACWQAPEYGDCLYHDEFGAAIDGILWAANDIRLGLGGLMEWTGEKVSQIAGIAALGALVVPVAGEGAAVVAGAISIGGSVVAGVGNLLQFEFKEAAANLGLGALGAVGRVAAQAFKAVLSIGNKAATALERGIVRGWEIVNSTIENWLGWKIEQVFP